MTNTRNLILKLKEVREEDKRENKNDWSYNKIISKIEESGGYPPSKTTLSRLFADGSEDEADSFSYEKVLIPVANAILGVDIEEETDSMDTKALKTLLKSKKERIEELEKQIEHLSIALDKEKIRSNEKLEEERERFHRSIDFLREQIDYKDQRMDLLLGAVQEKDKLHKEMLEKLIRCSCCEKGGARYVL